MYIYNMICRSTKRDQAGPTVKGYCILHAARGLSVLVRFCMVTAREADITLADTSRHS